MSALAVALIFAFAWLLTLATGDSSAVASMRGTARFVTWSGHLRASAWRCVLTLENLLLTPILDAAHLSTVERDPVAGAVMAKLPQGITYGEAKGLRFMQVPVTVFPK